MLRDKNLIPLSHQHQHALALCVRIVRAAPIPAGDLAAWQGEIAQIFETEIEVHFSAEERIVFPAAARFEELTPLLQELTTDHSDLRRIFAGAKAGAMSADEVLDLAQRLSGHIRKEERHLFERMQQLLTEDELTVLGSRLDAALKGTPEGCLLPSEATRLRPRK